MHSIKQAGSPQPGVGKIESAEQPEKRLSRDLGVGSIVLMVVAAAAPLTVAVATIPVIISVSESIALPYFFGLTAVILLLFTVGYVRMSKYVKNAGAFYSYVQAGLGPVQGLGAATLAILSYSGLMLATSSYIGTALSNLVVYYSGVEIRWWIFSFLTLAVVAFLGYRDIALSSRVLGIVLLLEVVIAVILTGAIYFQGGDSGFTAEPLSLDAFTSGNPALGLMFAFFGFFGFEATAVFRSEARDPERTIPRATYLSVIFIGVFYAVVGHAIVMGVGANGAVGLAQNDAEGLVLGLSQEFVGTFFFNLLQILLVTSLFACILSFHNVVTRYVFTLSRRGIFSPKLGEVSNKHNAPSNASFLVTAAVMIVMAVIVLVGLDPVNESYTWLAGASTLGLVALMTLTSAAVIVFFWKQGNSRKAPWTTVISPALAVLGLGTVFVLVAFNFTLLISDPVAATIVAAMVVLVWLAGMGLAVYYKRFRPEVYARSAEV